MQSTAESFFLLVIMRALIILACMVDAFEKLNRHLAGANQAALAKLVGASQGMVSKWARRIARPNTRHIAKLNKVLGTTFEQWLRAPLDGKRRAA